MTIHVTYVGICLNFCKYQKHIIYYLYTMHTIWGAVKMPALLGALFTMTPCNLKPIQKQQFSGFWRVLLWLSPIPIGSMYGIFTYIWLNFMVNVGKYKYTIHGAYGIRNSSPKETMTSLSSPTHRARHPCHCLWALPYQAQTLSILSINLGLVVGDAHKNSRKSRDYLQSVLIDVWTNAPPKKAKLLL